HMYGFLGYPLLQAADILIYRPAFVPVGEDQVAHVELTREVARRFNQFYKLAGKPVFPEPEALLTTSPKLLGSDKRKMSKSYGNTILLSDDAATVEEKIKNSVTDRPKLTDKGSPDRCPVGNLHQIFSDRERLEYITRGCTNATITCVECKALAVQSVNVHLEPIRQRRRDLVQHPERLQAIIQHGAQKAARAAEDTMRSAREAVGVLAITATGKVGVQTETAGPMRIPESAATAGSDQERSDMVIDAWAGRVSKTHPFRKDRPRTFITRMGRKVGIHTGQETQPGEWEFSFADRPLNVVVLLAEDRDRYLHDYILPPKFLQEYWKKFQRRNDLVEIAAKKTGKDISLLVDGNSLPIQQYEADYAALE